jgi:putative ABC transport system permease protein
MVLFSLKNLLLAKAKLVVGVLSLGLAISLVLTLLGVYSGIIAQARSMPMKSKANYWILHSGARDMFHTVSLLPVNFTSKVEALTSVDASSAAIVIPQSVRINKKEVTVGVVAFDGRTGMLGPPKLIKGRNPRHNEIVVDSALQRTHRLKLGQFVGVLDHTFQISGFSSGSNAVMFQYVFVRLQDYQAVQTNQTFVNYILVQSSTGLRSLRNEVQKLDPSLDVRSAGMIADSNVLVMEEGFLNIVRMLVGVAFLVGTLIVLITVYNLTIDRLGDYAVLSAVGASAWRLKSAAWMQSVVLVISGLLVAVALYFVLVLVTPHFMPSIEIRMEPGSLALVSLLMMAMAFLGSTIPVARISKVDPVSVFSA